MNSEAAFTGYVYLAQRLAKGGAPVEAVRCIASSLRLHGIPPTAAEALEAACEALERGGEASPPTPEVQGLLRKRQELEAEVRTMPAGEADPRVERAVEWTRAWLQALPASVFRALRPEEVEVLRWILARVVADQPVHASDIPVPRSMRRGPFFDM